MLLAMNGTPLKVGLGIAGLLGVGAVLMTQLSSQPATRAPDVAWERLYAQVFAPSEQETGTVHFEGINRNSDADEAFDALVDWARDGGQYRSTPCASDSPVFNLYGAIRKDLVQRDVPEALARTRLKATLRWAEQLVKRGGLIEVAAGMVLLSEAQALAESGALDPGTVAEVRLPERMLLDAVIRNDVCTHRQLQAIVDADGTGGDPMVMAVLDGAGLRDWERHQLALISTFETQLAATSPDAAFDAFAAEWRRVHADVEGSKTLRAVLTPGILSALERVEGHRRSFLVFARSAPAPVPVQVEASETAE